MKERLQILLAEDNHGDVLLVREALREHYVEHELHVVRDGLQAARYIERIGEASDAPCPDVLLLRPEPAPPGRARASSALPRAPVVWSDTGHCHHIIRR